MISLMTVMSDEVLHHGLLN